ncbi:trypsin-like serine peptidase [Sphingomonas quercus]|uniref:Serine protease n=1 Tax=Sphingomonas quercus TaxID=2842451 RepID=A0ABS6BNZ5_9SPHN|nr:serine protease [Sphingomonas quercus]MBU3078925.1 serine protease [Sphingomonas quercus]
MHWMDGTVRVPRSTARLARTGQPRGSAGLGLEAAAPSRGLAAAPGLPREDRVEMLRAGLDARNADPELAAALVAGAQTALPKLDDGRDDFTIREAVALEAVVLTDGTRPSLTIRDGYIDLAAAEVGEWRTALSLFRPAIEKVIRSVARINVPVKPFFAGTGFVVADDLVITNRHVAEAIAVEGPRGTWTLRWPDATTLDFLAEDGAPARPSARVTDIPFAGPDPIAGMVDFGHLDVAVLRCTGIGGARLPDAVSLDAGPDRLAESGAFCAIGFPARPLVQVGDAVPPPGFETSAVISSVFHGDFGVKKLAPGRIEDMPGALPGDRRKWVLSHDASTLGGNSGSALVDLDADGGRIIGIHFGGISREENYGHGFAAIRASLPDLIKCFA